jgi:hypothetical protein
MIALDFGLPLVTISLNSREAPLNKPAIELDALPYAVLVAFEPEPSGKYCLFYDLKNFTPNRSSTLLNLFQAWIERTPN